MNKGANDARRGEMTLVFALPAIERFADPAAVFESAREWSRYIGVVDNDAEAVGRFVDRHGLRPDFGPGDADKWLAMENIGESTHTPRHVFVGATVEDRRIADHLGWEFRDPETVAEKAGWDLADGSDETGLLDRLKTALTGDSQS